MKNVVCVLVWVLASAAVAVADPIHQSINRLWVHGELPPLCLRSGLAGHRELEYLTLQRVHRCPLYADPID